MSRQSSHSLVSASSHSTSGSSVQNLRQATVALDPASDSYDDTKATAYFESLFKTRSQAHPYISPYAVLSSKYRQAITAESISAPSPAEIARLASAFGPNPDAAVADKDTLIRALDQRRFSTLLDLRRVERILARINTTDVHRPMTIAWLRFVNTNSLLVELRGLTRSYPFSSECIEEAKRLVHQDPQSNRSWNYCWLILVKIRSENLIALSAQKQASQPQMWGGRTPSAANVDRLKQAFVDEWTQALDLVLRHWETPPLR